MQENKNIVIGAFVLWLFFGTYWYTCNIKYLCDVVPKGKAEFSQLKSGEIFFKKIVVNFLPNDSHKISEFSDSQVSLVADFLIAHRDKSVKVVGHTNFHRNIFYAENLGLERAKQIREILIKKGVNEEQIYLESKGMREMLVSPDNRKNTFLNRRVEIILK